MVALPVHCVKLVYGMLVFVEGGKSEDVEKNPRSQDKNQQQDARSCNLTQATAVRGKHSYHERPW